MNTNFDPHYIFAIAERELRDELHREAVEREKLRLRERMNQSPWQRLIDKLPFTINFKRKSK